MSDLITRIWDLEKKIEINDREIAKKTLENHVATMKDLGDVTIIDLRKPGYKHEGWIRYLFENDEYRLTISGDYGDVSVWNGYRDSNISVDSIHCYFNYADYFVEKIKASQEGKIYKYNEELAKLQLIEALSNVDDSDLINAYYLDGDKEDFINDLLYDFSYCDGFKQIRGSIYADVLDRLDESLISDMYDMGRVLSGNIYLYLEGLRIAMKQLHIGIYSK